MRRRLLLLGSLLAASAVSSWAAENVPALVQQLAGGSDEARLKLIEVGLPAAPALVQLMGAQPGRPAAEAERTIGWIVDRAAERPDTRAKAEWMLLNLLIDPRQPAPVRHMAAGLLAMSGSGAS